MNGNASSRTDDNLLDILRKRQERILSRLPFFAKVTSSLAVIGLLVTFIAESLNAGTGTETFTNFIPEINLGDLIAFFLGIFSSLVIWIFVIWSLSFVPFVAYYAHKKLLKN